MITNFILFMASKFNKIGLFQGLGITVEKKTFLKCAERMRREQVPQPRNVSVEITPNFALLWNRFLEI